MMKKETELRLKGVLLTVFIVVVISASLYCLSPKEVFCVQKEYIITTPNYDKQFEQHKEGFVLSQEDRIIQYRPTDNVIDKQMINVFWVNVYNVTYCVVIQ